MIVILNFDGGAVWGEYRGPIVGDCPIVAEPFRRSYNQFIVVCSIPVMDFSMAHAQRVLFLPRLCACLVAQGWALASEVSWADGNPLALPAPGFHQLQVLSPTILELTLITSKQPDPARVIQWDFVDANQELHLPSLDQFAVRAGGTPVPVEAVGFKRRVLYAPLAKRDLRIANYLYLQ